MSEGILVIFKGAKMIMELDDTAIAVIDKGYNDDRCLCPADTNF